MFGSRGRSAGSILTTGPIITSCQSGRASAMPRKQRDVEPLVEHAEESEPRPRQVALIGGIVGAVTGRGEMRDVDAARHRVDVVVLVLLGLVERLAAGEHHVGAPQQRLLERGAARSARS